jgi:CheY-like chemotaxis protein
VRLISETQGKEASTRARKELPDLILLDLNLPDMNGTEVLRQLKEVKETRSIPVVIISADAMPAQQKRLLQLGAVRYLTKPLDVIALLKVIDEFIS